MKFLNFVHKKFGLGFVLICASCALLAQQKEMPKADASKLIEDEIKAEMAANPNRHFDKVEVALNIYRKTLDVEKKRQCLEFIKTNPDEKCAHDSSIIIYAITENDSNFKNYFEEAKEKLSKFPEVKFWRKMLDFYSSPYSGEGFAEKYIYYAENFLNAGEKLSSSQKYNLAAYYVFGDSQTFETRFPSITSDPNLEKAIRLLNESIEDGYMWSARLLIKIYKNIGDKKSADKLTAKLFDAFQSDTVNFYTVKNILIDAITRDDYSVVSKEKIDAFVENLCEEGKGALYSELAVCFTYAFDGSPKNVKKGKEYSMKAFEYTLNASLHELFDICNEAEVRQYFERRKDNPKIVLEFANYLAGIGNWSEAFKFYQNADKMKNQSAAIGLFVAYEEGKGVAKNSKIADEFLSEIAAKIKDDYNSPVYYYNIVTYKTSPLNTANKATREKFFKALLQNPDVSELARLDLMNLYRLDLSEKSLKKLEAMLSEVSDFSAKHYEVWGKMYDFYSSEGKFQDLKKLFEYAKRSYYAESTATRASYIWMLASGIGCSKDEKKAFESIAFYGGDLNNPHYMNHKNALYAYCYENGVGVEKDTKKAQEFRDKTAGLYVIGDIFMYSNLMPKQNEYLIHALQMGYKSGNYTWAAYSCADGRFGIEKDEKRAIELFEKSAKQETSALFEIAKIYKRRMKTGQDLKKYVEYLDKCERQLEEIGDEPSAEMLLEFGYSHLNGVRGKKDAAKAVEYFTKVETKSFSKETLVVREALACCYENAMGVKKSLKKAEALRTSIKNFNGSNSIYSSALDEIIKLYDAKELRVLSDNERCLAWEKFKKEKKLVK